MGSSTTRRTPSNPSTRRKFLQQVAIGGMALGPGSAFLASCATAGGDDDEPEDDDDGDVAEPPEGDDADNPFGLDPNEPLEIYIFDGGFGDEYATELHQPIFSERWPDVEIDHNAEVDIAGALQPRFVEGRPPDFINNSGAGQIDPGQLVSDGLLHDLTELFDAPSWDDPNVPVRDTLVPGAIESGTFGDAPYVLNYAFTVYGIWYNKTLFDEHGWTVPRTWQEMLDLCEEIQGQGIAPWTYQGQHPRYMNWPLLSMATKLAGPEILVDIDNLVPGAWEHEAIREAASALAGLREAGYILDGTEGMDHRQAQGAWAEGRAAFVPCGSWLENEEADVLPDDFEIAVMPEPMLSDNGAMPWETIRATAGEPYVVPAQANNPQAGLEYMRAMLSHDGARGFTERVSSLTAVRGAADGLDLPPGLSSAQEALTAAGDNVINWFYVTWYRAMENPGIDALTGDLLTGRITPDEWIEGCENEAAAVRDDDSLQKYTREL